MATPSGSNRKVTIVGAGVVGMSCAVHLLRDGHNVTVIDKDEPGLGCSFGNAGILAPTYCVPLSMPGTVWNVPEWLFDPLGPLSVRWRDMPGLTPWFLRFILAGTAPRWPVSSNGLRSLHESCVRDFEALFQSMDAGHLIKKTGMIYAYESEKNFHKSSGNWEIIRQHGAQVEVLDGKKIQEMVPGISPACANGVFMPEDAQVISPLRVVETLVEEFKRNGGVIVRSEVRDIEIGSDGPTRLVTDGGAVDLDALVIAAGALSARFCRRLGSPVPLVGERGYHVTLPDPGISTDMPVMSGDCQFAMTTMEMGMRAAGTAEFANLEAPPNYQRARVLLKHVKRIFPTINTEGYSEWMGMRPSLPDSLPVIGTSPNFSSTFFAFGHSHAGLMGSVITGRTISDLVSLRTPGLDPTPFRINRF
ncbi:MAG: FAD-binding oxidoreductase [Rhodospirillales bacterium]|nr:FAD-binding oxidoreductase [Rhodospirillales bacterium]